jgi:hypothetical protein
MEHISAFPHFHPLSQCSLSRYDFPQDDYTNECILLISILVSTVTGSLRPIVTPLLSGSPYPFTFRPRPRAYSHIEPHRTRSSLPFSLFQSVPTHPDPYRSRLRRLILDHIHFRRPHLHFHTLLHNSQFHIHFLPTTSLTRSSRVSLI